MRFASSVVIGLLGSCLIGCHSDSTPPTTEATPAATTGAAGTTGTTGTTPTKAPGKLTDLKIEDIKVGTGEGAKAGDQLTMKYTGSLANGSVFDSNDKPDGQPFKFVLGAGSVIKGWDQGLVGMKKGGKRKLSIPSGLGYGSQSQGDKIPPNSDLYFTVTLDKISRKEDMGTVIVEDKKVGDGPAAKNGDYVQILYVTSSDDGSVIDNRAEKKPFTFKIGGGDVVPVIDQVVVGMKKGGERVATVPAELLHAGPQVHPGGSMEIDIHLVKFGK